VMLFEHCSVLYFINTFCCYPARLRPELTFTVIIPSHDIYSTDLHLIASSPLIEWNGTMTWTATWTGGECLDCGYESGHLY